MSAQVQEKLILNGEMTFMLSTPLVPSDDQRVVKVRERNIPKHSIAATSACRRKYLGTWEVKEGKLYLDDVEGLYRLRDDSPVFADWFTGDVRVPSGEVIGRRGYEQIYEKELLISIEEGVVIKIRTRRNESPLQSQ